MVRKTNTPSFVLELALQTTPADERRLARGLFVAATRLNNTLLQQGLRIVQALRSDPAWDAARKMPRTTGEQRKSRAQAFSEVRKAHGFTEYDFQGLAIHHKNAAGFHGRIPSHVAQKLGTKVFSALEQYVLGARGKPRFKSARRALHSVEGKNNEAGVRWNEDDGCVYLESTWAIAARMPDLRKDEWLWTALRAPTKYCRILWRIERGTKRWYVQLVQEGLAPLKATVAARLADVAKDATVGIDIGPSQLAWCSETEAGLFTFCAEVQEPQRLVRRLQRKADRQRRANNPDNFEPDGTVKKGRKTWVRSKRQGRTEQALRSAQSRTAARRKQAHGRDINRLLGKGRHFLHDGVSAKSLQKNFGKSVGARAP